MRIARCRSLRWTVALALLTLATSAGAARQPVFLFPSSDPDPAALNAGLPAAELGYHPDKDSSWGESWYFLAVDGKMNQIWILLSVSNYSPIYKFAGTVDLFYYGADGTKHRGHSEFKSDQVKADLAGVNVNIGGSTIVGAHPTYKLDLAAGDLQMKLTYQAETPDFLLGQGRLYFGEPKERYWTVGVMTPRAKVTGTVTAGGKTFDFSGKGYFDHGRSNIKIPDFSRWWYVIRVFEDDLSLGMMQIVLKDKYDAPAAGVIHMTIGDRVVVNSGGLTLEPSGKVTEPHSGIAYPDTFRIAYDDGRTKVRGTVKMETMTEAMNVLDQLSPFVRGLVKALYTDPWQFRLVGRADLTVETGGTVRKLTGRAIGEIHHYK